jgi:hypothetical protein
MIIKRVFDFNFTWERAELRKTRGEEETAESNMLFDGVRKLTRSESR